MDAHTPPNVAGPIRPASEAPSTFRDLPPRALIAFKWLANALGSMAVGVIFILVFALGSQHGHLQTVFTLLLPGILLALSVHECGHWWAARWRRMFVEQIVIGALQIQPRRRGLRWRFGRSAIRGFGGYVVAYTTAGRDARRDLIWLALGGPVANLCAALLCGAVAWWLERSPAQTVWVLLVVLNLSGFVFNLIPRKVGTGSCTDGLWIARAWLNRFEDLPGATFMSLQSRILDGDAIRDLPAWLMQRLLDEPEPMPVVHDWLQIYAALEVGELDEADLRLRALSARIEQFDEPMRLALADMLTPAWIDLVFARVIRGLDPPAVLDTLKLESPALWFTPQVPPRVRALAAALRGDAAMARAQLQRSRRYADNTPNPGVVSIEARLREQIQAIIDPRATEGLPSPSTQ